jgi:TetR/AcrR family transcriptional regulator, transcriptional repressor for nem operon
VEDASERVRAEGLSGAAVSAVMRDTGLTHGGFYKHFRSKHDLLVESLGEAFRKFTDTLVRAAEQSPSGEGWKAVVKTYLRLEMCEHPERGCPLAALAPELARVDKRMRPQIVTQLVNYKSRMVHFRSKHDLLVESLGEAFRKFTVHAWPANRRQRTSVRCNFVNDAGSN